MFHQTLLGRTTVLASALAGLLLAGCNRSDENAVNPATTATATDKASGTQPNSDHGFLSSPQIPTADQIKVMESLTPNAKKPVLPLEQTGTAALAKTAGADVNVGFNDYNALALPADHDYLTFAPFYIQKVTASAWAYVFPMNDGHFHMSYENPNVCFLGVPVAKYGLTSGTSCIVKGDAATQPRNLSPHEATEVVQLYVWDGSRKYTFDFKSFYLPPTNDLRYGHVQIWIHKIDVGWRYWSDLPPATTGYTWFLPQTGIGGAQGIDEIRVQSPNPAIGFGWTIDNMIINVH